MKVQVFSSDLEEMLFESQHPCFFENSSGVRESRYSTDMFLGKGSYRQIQFLGIYISYGETLFVKDTRLYMDSETEAVEMRFELNGKIAAQTSLNSPLFSFMGGEHNILYLKDFRGYLDLSGGSLRRVLEIVFEPSVFLQHLPLEYQMFKAFKRLIDTQNTGLLSKRNYPITKSMYGIISDIISCQRQGTFKRMFLESKIVELLLLQLEQINSLDATRLTKLGKKDIEKIYAVKEMLENDFKHIETIANLARMVGTNAFVLKKGFRELFGTSVFQYWKRLRLYTARELIQEKGLSVQETARKIGYKNPQHFTTAFKREFGITPGNLKDSRQF